MGTEVSDLTRGRNNEYHQDGYVLSFCTVTSTPLYSSTWTPTSISAYAGRCIFLIVLAVLFRLLVAFKAVLEERCIDAELNRRYVVIIRKQNTKERISSGSDSKIALLGTFLGSLAVGKYATGAVTDQTLHA